MARKFDIPAFYRSPIISTLKKAQRVLDSRKRDLTPAEFDLGEVKFRIARHFGLCYGVENAIEIAYRAIAENPEKRIFLLSEMIHNPHVNSDLRSRGVQFLMSPDGKSLISFDELNNDDVVIVPAFGTTVEMFKELESRGINPQSYNTTCPFVEKVWKRAAALGEKGYSVIIHGKHYHEETRATFSHARLNSPALVIRDMNEANILGEFITGKRDISEFQIVFAERYSEGFDPSMHLQKIGVVNQTTMLANETQEIADLLKSFMLSQYGEKGLADHFADTRDTLCYATQENQAATNRLIESGGDLALVVGGYNSSNTSHLVKLCQKHVPTFYIKDSQEMLSTDEIQHLQLPDMKVVQSTSWLPSKRPLTILLTAGASCPDVFVDEVIVRIAEFCGIENKIEGALQPFVDAASEEGPLQVIS